MKRGILNVYSNSNLMNMQFFLFLPDSFSEIFEIITPKTILLSNMKAS